MFKRKKASKSSVKNSTRSKVEKEYLRFRDVVKDLIVGNYGANVSGSKMIAVESKLIEYAAKGDYEIYAQVHCYDWEQEFRITKEDLYCLARTPREVLNIEELRLYGTANSALYDSYYKIVEPDEEGIIHDCPDVSRTYPIAKDSLLISENDVPLLKEAIDSGDLDLNIKQGKEKVDKKRNCRRRIPDNKFKQLCKDLEKESCIRGLLGEILFFRELSKKSKLTKYDKTERGYKPSTAKRRYYEVFPSKKTNQ